MAAIAESVGGAGGHHHLVVPGQVIASSQRNEGGEGNNSSSNDGGGFLRGHGTYVESVANEERLVASVCGIVQRVNKLVTVIPFSISLYQGHVGDLIVGRITNVGTSRWKVSLVSQQRDAILPLSGVHLPGGVQRVRTAQDQRDMRQFLEEGDLISAEVHKVQNTDGSLHLHTRSMRYSKLENGCLVVVPPSLIQRQKNQIITMINNTLDVLWGTNGKIWIQRRLKTFEEYEAGGGGNNMSMDTTANNNDAGGGNKSERSEIEELIRQEHSATPTTLEERLSIARVRNAIECLRLVYCMVTPENVETVYEQSIALNMKPSDMLSADNIIQLTALSRK